MNQTKKHSAIETVTNIGIGWLVSFGSQFIVFPLAGIKVPSISTNILISIYFTIISVARSYAIRRWFTNRKIA